MSLKDINPGSLLVDIVAAAVKKIRNRPKAVARRAAKVARKAARPRQPDEAAGEFFPNDEVKRMSIPKHWLSGGGIVAIVIGFGLTVFGIGECSPQEVAEAAQACVAPGTVDRMVGAVNELLIGGGAIVAAFGKKRAMKREAALVAKVEPK